MPRRAALALLGLVICSTSCATPSGDDDRAGRNVYLKSRVFRPGDRIDQRMIDYLEQHAGADLAPIIVQFDAPPDLGDRAAMKEAIEGIVLDAIPEDAYFFALPPIRDRVEMLLDGPYNVAGLAAIEDQDKIAGELWTGVPERAQLPGGQCELLVQFFSFANVTAQANALVAFGGTPVTRILPINGWRVRIDPAQIFPLSSSALVKWIEPIPYPPEDDNDVVRSTSGVSSDAVAPPSPWDLTGAGVVMAQWESRPADQSHNDFAGRIVLGDPPLKLNAVSHQHTDFDGNYFYDDGEWIYSNPDEIGGVQPGRIRLTPVDTGTDVYAAGSVVAAGDSDIGESLYYFDKFTLFTDDVVKDFAYTHPERVYRDGGPLRGQVDAGDFRVTAGVPPLPIGFVGSSDPELGKPLARFPTRPQRHATHVAGVAIGSGAESGAQGGGPNQWKGVAPGASLRSYSGNPTNTTGSPVPNDEYWHAATFGTSIAVNAWGTDHMHHLPASDTGYDSGSQYYDAVVSGRRSDGTPSGLPKRISIVASAGNLGSPERYIDLDGSLDYSAGEPIYGDGDVAPSGLGKVSAADVLLSGSPQPDGAVLVDFDPLVRHDDTVSLSTFAPWTYEPGEGIYLDADDSNDVSAGDTRLSGTSSTVSAGDADVGEPLRSFNRWGNIRVPNAAKDTLVVGSHLVEPGYGQGWPAGTSGRGPTRDGRIKPDLVAPGHRITAGLGITSTAPGQKYDAMEGTTVATGAAAGVAALVLEWYERVCSSVPASPALLRALLVHGAEILGGSRFEWGFGNVRTQASAELVFRQIQGTINGPFVEFPVSVEHGSVRVTLVWDDPPATANALPSPTTGLLQNDLDLVVIAPDGSLGAPALSDPSDPGKPTSYGPPLTGTIPESARDRRNTIEQVWINRGPGVYTIRVEASTLSLPPQDFVLVVDGLPLEDGTCDLATPADIWMRDTPTDDGTPPSSVGSAPMSPDIWNRVAPDGGLVHQDHPGFLQNSYLYAFVRTLSGNPQYGQLEVWGAYPATAALWPNDFCLEGRWPFVGLAGPGGATKVGPFPWTPCQDDFTGMLYARLLSPNDPITITETWNAIANIQDSNNITGLNILFVDCSSTGKGFLIRNVEEDEAELELTLRVPREFLEIGRVFFRPSAELDARWSVEERDVPGLLSLEPERRAAVGGPLLGEGFGDGELDDPRLATPRDVDQGEALPAYRVTEPVVTLRGLRLGPREALPASFVFESDQAEKETYDVTLTQTVGGEVVGGLTFRVSTGTSADVRAERQRRADLLVEPFDRR